MMRKMEMQQKQLALQERANAVDFQAKMHQMDLEQRRIEIERARQQMLPPGASRPNVPAGAPAVGPAPSPMKCPAMGAMPGPQACPMAQRHGKCGPHKFMFGMMAFWAVVNILLAIWVYQDIRKRNAGSGIWIVVTLMTGLLGALVYAVVRIGEKCEETKPA